MSLYPRILATAFFSLASSQLLANVTTVSMPAASITGAYAVAVGSQSSSQSIFRNDIVESGIYGNHFGYPEVSANVSILINEDPSPSLFVNASTDAINIGGITAQAYADAQLRYYFRIVGPNGQVPVTINAHADVFCSESVMGTCAERNPDLFWKPATANASLNISGLGQLIAISAYPSVGPGTGSFTSLANKEIDLNQTFMLTTNYNYQVNLETHVAGYSNGQWGGGNIWTQAFIDPTFTLAPGIANPELYSFAFSEGIGNTPAVPEPSSALFSLAGLGVIALARRRQQQRNCA